ncbi:MAG TPA: DNA gyrase C-terminal beta-propeller domain-containing protein, partial [Parachlamydiaceae bacterium]|nr:DNA gyrase C-terminal beta-propeller domain-containing protein [Parachlamydiaceae bacterium]
ELAKADARAHILEGYLKAIDHLDEVVRLIRASQNKEEAKKELISHFGFTDRQAVAVLDLKLYQLTGLERDKINEEYQELLKRIDHLKAVLASESMVKDIIREELQEIQKQHKSERQTQIIAAESEMNMEDLITNEEVIITISQDDYIKRMPVATFREQKRGGQGITGVNLKRVDDALKDLYVASTHDYLLIFTNLGRCYWIKVWQIPEAGRKSKGKPLVNLLEDIQAEEKIATVLKVTTFEDEACILMATKKGVVKKTDLNEFSNPRRKGIWALTIDDGDEVIAARLVKETNQVMLFTYKGMAVRFDQSNVRPMGRTARGVRGVSLKSEDDHVVGCEVVTGTESILVVCENGFGKRSAVDDFRQTNRGGVGVRSIVISERNGNVVGALSVNDEDGVILMSSTGQTVRINMRDARVMGRNTQGVKLVNLTDDGVLVAIQKVEGEEATGEENGLVDVIESKIKNAAQLGEEIAEIDVVAMDEETEDDEI